MGCSGRVVNTVRILNNGMKMIIHVVFCCVICLITERKVWRVANFGTNKYPKRVVFRFGTLNLCQSVDNFCKIQSDFYKTVLELPTGKYANSVFDLNTAKLKVFSCKKTT